jgi:hypothetical protein
LNRSARPITGASAFQTFQRASDVELPGITTTGKEGRSMYIGGGFLALILIILLLIWLF